MVKSYDVLAGTASTLTCSIKGSAANLIHIQWVDNKGKLFSHDSDISDLTVSDGALKDGMKESTMILLADVTLLGDQLFTCRISVGEKDQYDDTLVALKTFTVRTTNDYVRTGDPAVLKCTVIFPTDTLTVAWSHQNTIFEETRKETLQNSTTTTILRLDPPNEVASYTCIVFAHGQEYNFYSEVEIETDGLLLTPEQEIRAFNGATVNLKSSYFFSSFAEGHFWWKHNDSLCLTKTCRDIINSPKTSVISIIVSNSTVGAWRSFYTETTSKRILQSNQVILIGVNVSGTQYPNSVWGITGTESEVTCSVPFNMTNSILNNLRWKLDGKFVNNKGFTYNKHHDVIIFKMTEKVYGTTTVQWKIIVAHSTAAVGNLYCRAQYSTGQIVDTPMSHLNEIRIDSDLDLIVLTPDTGAVVTFITHAPSAPLSRNLDCSLDLVNPVSKSTNSKISTDGLIFTEVYHIRSSDSMIEAGSKDDLVSQHGTCDYSVRIQNSVQESLTVTVKFSLLGKIKLETGFEFSTDETNLRIKLRCKPPRTPPNTLLKKVEIAESDDYKYVVTCINDDLVFMDENAKEVICNTSTGSYHTKIDLSPCLRVIEQIYPN
ncbi:uncharacterized protein LOC134823701 [Bolinopsis microptera]|uniref:uncharacterized protein LOC134823701 n=1 Tax=Bolinopsis microptera TaxID=2820187 RepID=UPI003079B753